MPEIPLEDTPIFVKLVQEYTAREKFQQYFIDNPLPEDYMERLAALGETHKVRGGSVQVFGNPIA